MLYSVQSILKSNCLKKGNALFLMVALCLALLPALSPIPIVSADYSATPGSYNFATNGNVNDIVTDSNGIAYLGGSFTQVGIYRGRAVPLNTSTAALVGTFPTFDDDSVREIISDCNDGWFIGGGFSTVNGSTTRNLLAHVNSSGTVTDFNPNITHSNGGFSPEVNSLAIDCVNDQLFVGGFFDLAGGTARDNLVSYDISDADPANWSLTAWNPDPSSSIQALAYSNSYLYVGGLFTSFNATADTRNRIAAFDVSNADPSVWSLATWNPNASSGVTSITIDGDYVYIGGSYTTLASFTRTRLSVMARIGTWDTSGSNLDNCSNAGYATDSYCMHGWQPNMNSTVEDIEISGTNVYVSGSFTTANGSARKRIASFDGSNANPTNWTLSSWDPNISSTVYAIEISGTTLFAAGEFTTVNNDTVNDETRNYLASFDTTTNTNNVTAWDPNVNTRTRALAISGTTLYAGGDFTLKDPTTREYIAAVNPATGAITSFDPNLNSTVEALAIDGTTLFAGGSFTTANDGAATAATRNRLASFDTTAATENVTAWNPDVGGTVYDVLIEDSVLYIGGNFTTVNNVTDHAAQLTRYDAAAFDYVNDTDGTANSWSPDIRWYSFGFYDDFTAAVYSLKAYNDNIYIGGGFNKINYTPDPDTDVDRSSLAAVNNTDGTVTDWDPDIPGEFTPANVYAVEVLNGVIYAGGDFTTVNTDVTRNRIAAFDPATDTSNVTDWNPNMGGTVRALEGNGTIMYAGGDFTTANGGATHNRLVALDTTVDAGTVLSSPNVDSSVYSIYSNSSYLFAGGAFTTVGGAPRLKVAYFALSNSAPSTPTTLAPTAYVDGTSGTDTTPTLTFTTADTNNDTVQYQIQIDDSSDFGSPVVDYTSALAVPGASTFTVGQAAGSGTYAVGEASQTLAEASYYWRVKAIDNHGSESAYATANSGEVAFIVASAGGSATYIVQPPTNLEAVITENNEVKLSWVDAPKTGYVQIFRGIVPEPVDGGSVVAGVEAGVEEYIDSNVKLGDIVSYKLKTVSGSINVSSYSETITITVEEGAGSEVTAPAEEPTGSNDTPEDQSADELTWEDEMALVIKWGILTKEYEKAANKCEALVMLTRVAQLAEAEGWDVDQTVTDDGFDDTPLWCKPYAKLAKDKGLVEGRTPTELGTQGSVNRYEVAMMLARVLGATEADMEAAAELDLYDDEIVDWAKGAVNWLNEQGVMTGYPDITFNGEKATIKIELAVAFARAFDLFNKLQ